ncbi:stage III sporulation protein AE [Tepidibacter hydrothermalis]|uniref:Stage III sporulation protein AE n=1 Tax=Tepidibacter hydrothermalis TaxID=3036126 RepID=A0ABY8EB95_9FIRM|nr:stage III sporulation protein AE [Tepidibacter hydrothermalis]WFD09059.1 stage III sporulation protein AE [Tepidibacter hydrothermalis]
MKRRAFVGVLIMFFLLTNLAYAQSDAKGDINKYIDNQLKTIQIDRLQKTFENEQVLKNINLKNFIMDVMKGKKNVLDIIDKGQVKNYLFKEIKFNFKILVTILILSLISAILKNLDNSFSGTAISKVSNYTVFVLLISITFMGYKDVLEIARVTIDSMVNFMQIAIPIEMAFLVTLGFPVTSASLSPIFLGGIVFINIVFKTFLMVIMALSFSILIINNISSNINLKRLYNFTKQISVFTVGFLLTVYLGIISIQGIYVTSFDKFSIKTIKFAVDFIPVVGGFVSDSIEILLSSSYLLKSVLGAAALVILIGICLIPVFKIVSIILVYKISSIIVEPISDDNISTYLNEMANLMIIILSSVVAVGIMFFITIAILASIGNVTRM